MVIGYRRRRCGNGNAWVDRRIHSARVLEVRSEIYISMPVSVVAEWSSRGEPRFVEMLDALMH